MCGIAGFAADLDDAALARLGDRIAHRGPDDWGRQSFTVREHRIGLAHRRLSIIDLSEAGHQPMTVDCPACAPEAAPPERVWLTYNGEIYNFQELKQGLVARGHVFRSRTDSEVLIHLYCERGVDFLAELNGIFALAIYDGRPRGSLGAMRPGDLLLARDGLGVKPLYYCEDARGLYFASELKALLTLPIDRQLDPQSIHDYLAFSWCPAPRTPFTAVRKLHPGEYVIARDGKARHCGSFYRLPAAARFDAAPEAEIVERVREVLARSVRRQLISDVQVGAFLSGGLDSSAVVAFARREPGMERLPCYTISVEGQDREGFAEDLPYARRVAAHLGVELREVLIEPQVIRRLDEMIYALDEPQGDPAPINALIISERARADGIKVLLSGAGGDDLFSGYRRHRALQLERLWSWWPQSVRSLLARTVRNARDGRGPLKSGSPWGRRAVRAFSFADLEGDERIASYFLSSTERARRELYQPGFLERLGAHRSLDPLLASLALEDTAQDPLNRMLFLEQRHFLADHNLNYTDKVSMAYGVEVRVPLLDLELVALASTLPPGLKQRGAVGKYVFKKAMEPYLPHDVIHRPKTGFGAPLRQWLHVDLAETVADLLSPRSLDARGIFDARAVARLVQLDRERRVDAAYLIFSVMCIELWCRIFVDGRLPAVGWARRDDLIEKAR